MAALLRIAGRSAVSLLPMRIAPHSKRILTPFKSALTPVKSVLSPVFKHAPDFMPYGRCDAMYCGFSTRVAPAFDTHDLVKRLMASGFTSEQAEVVLQSMKQAAEQYAHTADSIYPTKIEMIEKNLAYKADFAAMKSDLVLMLKQDVALLKNEIHKLETVIGKETTAYQTKLEQLENKSIKFVIALLASAAGIVISAYGVYIRLQKD